MLVPVYLDSVIQVHVHSACKGGAFTCGSVEPLLVCIATCCTLFVFVNAISNFFVLGFTFRNAFMLFISYDLNSCSSQASVVITHPFKSVHDSSISMYIVCVT